MLILVQSKHSFSLSKMLDFEFLIVTQYLIITKTSPYQHLPEQNEQRISLQK